jgi:adenine/guanine/hypoxanthine permease
MLVPRIAGSMVAALALRRIVDSVAAAAAGIGSVSSNTSYIESAAGVGVGGSVRTGLASVVTGNCFLLATFLTSLVEVIPYEAATNFLNQG